MMCSGVSYVSMRKIFTYFDLISYFDILMYQYFFFSDQTNENFLCSYLMDKSCKRITKAISNDGSILQNCIWILPSHHLHASEELAMKFGLPVDGIQSIRNFFVSLKVFIGNSTIQLTYNQIFFDKTSEMQAKTINTLALLHEIFLPEKKLKIFWIKI